MKLSQLLISLATTIGISQSAEWSVLYENVMAVAIGVSAPDSKTVYVSGGDNGSGATILKSSDEGSTWQSLSHDFQMMYLDIDVAKGTTSGIAPGLGLFGKISGASYTNDGEVFQSINDPPIFFASQSATAFDSQTHFMVASWSKVITGSKSGVAASFDGGQNLKYYDWGIDTQARYGSFPSKDLWFVSGGTWPAELGVRENDPLQLSPRIRLVRHKDGSISPLINTHPESMGNNKYEDGYLGVIARTTNGGRTFETVFNDTGRFYFNAIDCPDTKRCWAVAEGPAGAWIFHTPDGGLTWVEQYQSPTGSLFDIKFVNSLEGWAVGGSIKVSTFDALFLKTVDGGKTWVNQNTIPNAYPNSITIVNSERAYATAFLRNGLSSILVYR